MSALSTARASARAANLNNLKADLLQILTADNDLLTRIAGAAGRIAAPTAGGILTVAAGGAWGTSVPTGAGELLKSTAGDKSNFLAAPGAADRVLGSSGATALEWRTIATALKALMTTQGDLVTVDATPTPVRLAHPGAADYVLGSSGAATLAWTPRVACRVTRNAAQAILAAGTVVQWNSTEFEHGGAIHDPAVNNTRLTVPVAGRYVIGATLYLDSSGSGRFNAVISINGAGLLNAFQDSISFGAGTTFNIALVADMAAGDYAEVTISHSGAGASVNLNNAGHVRFWIARL